MATDKLIWNNSQYPQDEKYKYTLVPDYSKVIGKCCGDTPFAQEVVMVAEYWWNQHIIEETQNRSPIIDQWEQDFKAVQLGSAYCVIFVWFVLKEAAEALGITGVEFYNTENKGNSLATIRKFIANRQYDIDNVPECGDIFYRYSGAEKGTAFGHFGIVVAVDDNYFYTIEGNAKVDANDDTKEGVALYQYPLIAANDNEKTGFFFVHIQNHNKLNHEVIDGPVAYKDYFPCKKETITTPNPATCIKRKDLGNGYYKYYFTKTLLNGDNYDFEVENRGGNGVDSWFVINPNLDGKDYPFLIEKCDWIEKAECINQDSNGNYFYYKITEINKKVLREKIKLEKRDNKWYAINPENDNKDYPFDEVNCRYTKQKEEITAPPPANKTKKPCTQVKMIIPSTANLQNWNNLMNRDMFASRDITKNDQGVDDKIKAQIHGSALWYKGQNQDPGKCTGFGIFKDNSNNIIYVLDANNNESDQIVQSGFITGTAPSGAFMQKNSIGQNSWIDEEGMIKYFFNDTNMNCFAFDTENAEDYTPGIRYRNALQLTSLQASRTNVFKKYGKNTINYKVNQLADIKNLNIPFKVLDKINNKESEYLVPPSIWNSYDQNRSLTINLVAVLQDIESKGLRLKEPIILILSHINPPAPLFSQDFFAVLKIATGLVGANLPIPPGVINGFATLGKTIENGISRGFSLSDVTAAANSAYQMASAMAPDTVKGLTEDANKYLQDIAASVDINGIIKDADKIYKQIENQVGDVFNYLGGKNLTASNNAYANILGGVINKASKYVGIDTTELNKLIQTYDKQNYSSLFDARNILSGESFKAVQKNIANIKNHLTVNAIQVRINSDTLINDLINISDISNIPIMQDFFLSGGSTKTLGLLPKSPEVVNQIINKTTSIARAVLTNKEYENNTTKKAALIAASLGYDIKIDNIFETEIKNSLKNQIAKYEEHNRIYSDKSIPFFMPPSLNPDDAECLLIEFEKEFPKANIIHCPEGYEYDVKLDKCYNKVVKVCVDNYGKEIDCNKTITTTTTNIVTTESKKSIKIPKCIIEYGNEYFFIEDGKTYLATYDISETRWFALVYDQLFEIDLTNCKLIKDYKPKQPCIEFYNGKWYFNKNKRVKVNSQYALNTLNDLTSQIFTGVPIDLLVRDSYNPKIENEKINFFNNYTVKFDENNCIELTPDIATNLGINDSTTIYFKYSSKYKANKALINDLVGNKWYISSNINNRVNQVKTYICLVRDEELTEFKEATETTPTSTISSTGKIGINNLNPYDISVVPTNLIPAYVTNMNTPFERWFIDTKEGRIEIIDCVILDTSCKDCKDGKDGLPGKDGRDGKDGKNGIDGKAAAKGDKGEPGKNGIDGKNGKDGLPGPKGDKGDPGKDGITTIKYENTTNSNITKTTETTKEELKLPNCIILENGKYYFVGSVMNQSMKLIALQTADNRWIANYNNKYYLVDTINCILLAPEEKTTTTSKKEEIVQKTSKEECTDCPKEVIEYKKIIYDRNVENFEEDCDECD